MNLIASIDPAKPLAAYPNTQVQSLGLIAKMSELGALGARLQRVPDPDDTGRFAWLATLQAADPPTFTPGHLRTEIIPGFCAAEPGHDYTFAVSVRPGDWRQTSNTLVWQIHDSDQPGSTASPFVGLYIDGATMYVASRSGLTSPPASEPERRLWSDAAWTPNVWTHWIVQWREDPSGKTSFLKVWRNGVLIVSNRQALGYLEGGRSPYPKAGIYSWDMTAPALSCYLRGPFFGAGQVAPATMMALLGAPMLATAA